MRSHSTFGKLFVDFFVVIVVVIILSGAFSHWQLNAKYQHESREHQDQLASIAAEHFREMWPLEPNRIDEVCKKLLRDPAVRLTVIALDGKVLGDSDADPAKMVNHRTADRPEVLQAIEGREGSDTRKSETLQIPYRYVAVPVREANRPVAVVRLAVPVSAIAQGEAYARNSVLWSMAVGAVAAVLLSLVASWIWYRPIRRLTETVRRIAAGETSAGGGALSSGRLRELSAALEEMRDSLGEQVARIADEIQDFRAVVDALETGFLGVDADQKVVVANRSAAEALRTTAAGAIGMPLSQLLPSTEMAELAEQAMAADAPVRKPFEIDTPHGRRLFDVRAEKLPAGRGSARCLLVLHDVTKP